METIIRKTANASWVLWTRAEKVCADANDFLRRSHHQTSPTTVLRKALRTASGRPHHAAWYIAGSRSTGTTTRFTVLQRQRPDVHITIIFNSRSGRFSSSVQLKVPATLPAGFTNATMHLSGRSGPSPERIFIAGTLNTATPSTVYTAIRNAFKHSRLPLNSRTPLSMLFEVPDSITGTALARTLEFAAARMHGLSLPDYKNGSIGIISDHASPFPHVVVWSIGRSLDTITQKINQALPRIRPESISAVKRVLSRVYTFARR